MLIELAVSALNVFRYYRTRLRNESGATAVEYGLMVALIAAVIVAVVTLVGQEVATMFQDFLDSVPW